MKTARNLLISLGLLLLPLLALAQPEEDPSRFYYEKDWVNYRPGMVKPDTVKKLFIEDVNPLDLEDLKRFTGLSGLIIRDCQLANLDFLRDHRQLLVLELYGNTLYTLDGVQYLTQIRDFTCAHNFIRDISLLTTLRSLRTLHLYDNEIVNINPLRNLTELTWLDLGKNDVRDISAIAHFRKLNYLSLYSCDKLQDIRIIQNFSELEQLNLSYLEIPDFSLRLIEGLTKLEALRLQGVVRNNAELNHLRGLTALKQLTLGRNDSITCIDSLKYLVNLDYLDIHSNNVKDLSVIRHFPKLIKLVCYRNLIADISPLRECPSLSSLFLHENPIQDYTPLQSLLHLKHLDVSRKDFPSPKDMQLRKTLRHADINFI